MSIDATPRLRALGIDVDDIWQKAGESASLAMRDKALYGFTAIDRNGNRIDPQRIKSGIKPARSIFDRDFA